MKLFKFIPLVAVLLVLFTSCEKPEELFGPVAPAPIVPTAVTPAYVYKVVVTGLRNKSLSKPIDTAYHFHIETYMGSRYDSMDTTSIYPIHYSFAPTKYPAKNQTWTYKTDTLAYNYMIAYPAWYTYDRNLNLPLKYTKHFTINVWQENEALSYLDPKHYQSPNIGRVTLYRNDSIISVFRDTAYVASQRIGFYDYMASFVSDEYQPSDRDSVSVFHHIHQ